MKNPYKNSRANGSGQLLIVAALAIAILISSTTIYVYELSRERQSVEDAPLGDFILAVKQGTRNAVISALANVTKGGEKTLLAENLNTLIEAYLSLNQHGISRLSYAFPEDQNYEGGVRIAWSRDGFGISSAYADFTLAVYGLTANITSAYTVNITTTITLSGYYVVGEEGKIVSITCRVFNEGEPALARNIALHYKDGDAEVWTPVNPSSLMVTDYGNGTYNMSFTAAASSASLEVSAHVQDLRGILVKANTICHQI
ncbi:MAG: hypothetical protein RMJ15_02195 [Nitrososphaerota archaeon]|nr:hypothetical protein [Candidatus Bathyarchaeota archaeon]MDW8022544.1 hypothetical protein [Nitrososphaerota archaeon]